MKPQKWIEKETYSETRWVDHEFSNKWKQPYHVAMHKKYDHYKESILSLELTDHYICELMRAGAITKTKIDKVYNEFMNPSYRYDAHERSVWSLLNSVTHCNKGLGYVEQIRRTQRLHNVFDNLLAVA